MDYDRWSSEYGCEGWNWESIQPHFLRLENWHGEKNPLRGKEMTAGVSLSAPSFLSSFLRSFLSSFFFFFLVLGSSGPIDVTRFETHDTVLTEPSIRAAESLGHKFLNDYNLGKNTGISRVRTKKKKKKRTTLFYFIFFCFQKQSPPPSFIISSSFA